MIAAEVLELSWQVQVSLASGYAGYILACSGQREGHKTIDAIFITLLYSLITTLLLFQLAEKSPPTAGFLALAGTCVSALLWRMVGRRMLWKIMRGLNFSWSNDDPSALATISNNTRAKISQIAVLLDDGTWLRCDDTSQFASAPFGPCILGPNGDVALYLTHEEKAGKRPRALKTVRNACFGDRITYIPSAKIRRITLRHICG